MRPPGGHLIFPPKRGYQFSNSMQKKRENFLCRAVKIITDAPELTSKDTLLREFGWENLDFLWVWYKLTNNTVDSGISSTFTQFQMSFKKDLWLEHCLSLVITSLVCLYLLALTSTLSPCSSCAPTPSSSWSSPSTLQLVSLPRSSSSVPWPPFRLSRSQLLCPFHPFCVFFPTFF